MLLTKNSMTKSQQWSALGPLLLTCTLLAIAIRPTATPWEMPVIAIGGLFLCYQWRWKGVWTALALLAAVTTYIMLSAASAHLFWMIALTFSIASSFIITGLSLEEAGHLWEHTHKDTKSRLESSQLYNERLQTAQQRAEQEKNELVTRYQELQEQYRLSDKKREEAEQLISFIREELGTSAESQQQISQELLEARKQVSAFQQRLERLSHVAQIADTHDAQVEELKRLLAARDKEIEHLSTVEMEKQLAERGLLQLQSEFEGLSAAHQQQEIECEQLKHALEKTQEKATISAKEAQQMQEQLQRLQRDCDHGGQDKQLLQNTLDRLHVEMETLRAQNQQKTQQLNACEAMIENLKSASAEASQQFEMARVGQAELKRVSEKKEQQLTTQLKELEEKFSLTNRQLASCNERIRHDGDLKEQVAQLQQELDEKYQSCQKLSDENAVLIEQLKSYNEQQLRDPEPAVDEHIREARRFEGLYLQLRQQFNEKAKELDATRRELFFTKNQLFSLHRDGEEHQWQVENDTANMMQHLISDAVSEINAIDNAYRVEIDQLHQLIATLIKS